MNKGGQASFLRGRPRGRSVDAYHRPHWASRLRPDPLSFPNRYATQVTMMDYAKRVRENVEQYGFHTTSVGAGDRPAYSYSTGIFKSYQLPEIIISALPPRLCHDLISQYVARFRASALIVNQRIVASGERFDYYLVPVSFERIKDLVLATLKFYNNVPVEFLQLIYPDTDFLFPDEVGYDYDQEIFGEFPPK